jgi:TolB-like protein/class 3 adenylate cyclase
MVEHRPAQRKLAAILAADIAGYSRLMGADEEGTLKRLKALRAELIDPSIAGHNGRIVKTTGDGLLVEFASVVDAMRCAVTWQSDMAERSAGAPADSRIEWRIGVNLGDVIIDGDDIFGDGVNIAARLEAMAEPGGICISRTVLTQTRGKLDFPVADLGDQSLKNIAQPIHVFRVLFEEKPMPEPAALPLPDKPSIAVLPFQNMSGDPEQEYFADGMVEEIITALSRIRWLFVIARNSSFSYKGESPDVKQVGRELGVRYVLEGSVRKGGNRVRITAQLIDTETGTHLWADRFDGSMEDVFELQDKVASCVAGVIEPALQTAEIRRSSERPTGDLTAYDLYLRALAIFWSLDHPRRDKETVHQALDLLERAIERDPYYGPALGQAAICHMHLTFTWPEDVETNRRKGVDRAQRALQGAGNDPAVIANAALALASLGEEIGATMALVDRAIALNPNYGRGWYVRGILRVWAGEPDAAIEDIEVSLRLNPRDHFSAPLLILGTAYFLTLRFEEAAGKLRIAIQDNPGYPVPYRLLAACYAQMGRLDDARTTVEQLRGITDTIVAGATLLRDPKHRELYLSGLRLAIGEEA